MKKSARDKAAEEIAKAAMDAVSAPATPAADAVAEFRAALGRMRPVTPAEERERTLREVIFPRLETWGFPRRFRVELPGWNCAAQEWVFRDVLAQFRGVGAIVALVGVRGTGKTTIAAQIALARAWRERETALSDEPSEVFFCPYRKLSDLVGRFKSLYADFGMIDGELLMRAREAICGASLAFIDELHECDALRVKDLLLTDFIDRRYSARRDTLLISNQTVEQFTASTSDSVLSRIAEHGSIIPCEWESWREKGAAR